MPNPQIDRYTHYLYMLFKGHIHSVLCHSKAGLGKTYTTIKLLKNTKVRYKYVNGVVTPVELYKLLYDNRYDILVLDDIETMFHNEYIINLLKAALWDVDGKREVSYKTSSKALEGYDSDFIYEGGLIILANVIKGRKDESFKALMSRCLKCELIYTLDEIKQISTDIINKKDLTFIQKQTIIDIIRRRIFPQHSFNFRLLDRLEAFVKYDIQNAEELFLGSLDVDEILDTFLTVVDQYDSVVEQQLKFTELTGKSKMTFYRMKKKLKREGLIK